MGNHPDSNFLKSAGVISVGAWRVDASILRITKDGKTTKLEPLTMATLLYFARHAGQTVTREELERELWDGQIVVYAALSNTIAKLRKALEDDIHTPQYIETIPKVGYRLVAEVCDAADEQPLEATRRSGWKLWLWIAVILLVLVTVVALTWMRFQRSRIEGAMVHPEIERSGIAPSAELLPVAGAAPKSDRRFRS